MNSYIKLGFLSVLLLIGCGGSGKTFQEKVEHKLEIYIGQDGDTLFGGAQMDDRLNKYASDEQNYTGLTKFGLVLDGVEKDLGVGGGGSHLTGQFSLNVNDVLSTISSKKVQAYCRYEIYQETSDGNETLMFSGKKYSDSIELTKN